MITENLDSISFRFVICHFFIAFSLSLLLILGNLCSDRSTIARGSGGHRVGVLGARGRASGRVTRPIARPPSHRLHFHVSRRRRQRRAHLHGSRSFGCRRRRRSRLIDSRRSQYRRPGSGGCGAGPAHPRPHSSRRVFRGH